MAISTILNAFTKGWKHVSRKKCNEADKAMRENLSEKQLDKTLMDSMDASDPPSTY